MQTTILFVKKVAGGKWGEGVKSSILLFETRIQKSFPEEIIEYNA